MSNEIKKNEELKNKGVKTNEVKNTDLSLDKNEVLQIERDKILKFSKKMSIEGWTYASGEVYDEEKEKFSFIQDKQFGVQFTTIVEAFDEVKGCMIDEKHTMKLNLILEPEELNKMVGKVYLFDDLDKYPSENKKTLNFGCSNMPTEIKELEGQFIHELLVETRAEVQIRKVYDNIKLVTRNKKGKREQSKVNTGDCIIQRRIYIDNGSGGIFPIPLDIIVRKTKRVEVEALIGQKMKIKNLETYYINGKTVIETKTKPSL